jgi:hypothetical protein
MLHGWTSSELIFGFTLVTISIGNKSIGREMKLLSKGYFYYLLITLLGLCKYTTRFMTRF